MSEIKATSIRKRKSQEWKAEFAALDPEEQIEASIKGPTFYHCKCCSVDNELGVASQLIKRHLESATHKRSKNDDNMDYGRCFMCGALYLKQGLKQHGRICKERLIVYDEDRKLCTEAISLEEGADYSGMATKWKEATEKNSDETDLCNYFVYALARVGEQSVFDRIFYIGMTNREDRFKEHIYSAWSCTLLPFVTRKTTMLSSLILPDLEALSPNTPFKSLATSKNHVEQIIIKQKLMESEAKSIEWACITVFGSGRLVNERTPYPCSALGNSKQAMKESRMAASLWIFEASVNNGINLWSIAFGAALERRETISYQNWLTTTELGCVKFSKLSMECFSQLVKCKSISELVYSFASSPSLSKMLSFSSHSLPQMNVVPNPLFPMIKAWVNISHDDPSRRRSDDEKKQEYSVASAFFAFGYVFCNLVNHRKNTVDLSLD